jgi:hypothetical protein
MEVDSAVAPTRLNRQITLEEVQERRFVATFSFLGT